MPTNPNMVAIQTVTVGAGGASSISFTSIPQTYTDLVVVLSLRADSGTSFNDTRMTINSSTSGYTSRLLYGTGSSTGSANNNTYQYAYWVGSATTPSYTASTFSNIEVYIPNYSSSNNKSASVTGVAENNGTLGTQLMTALLWANSNAITSLSFTQDYGNYVQYSTATLYGVTSAGYGAKATGGIITSDANYYYHTFLASGTFTPTSNITADYLVVAGGGGGSGGGGGAGGLRCTVGATGGGGSLESALSLTSSTNYTVTIGAGGAAGASAWPSGSQGTNGSNSVFGSITSTGGGGGAQDTAGTTLRNGNTGGSGGGCSWNNAGGVGGSGTANQGFAGGNGQGGPNFTAGGGGGAGAVGVAGNGTNGGAGGAGITTSISGTSTTYAGGGGGGVALGSNNGGTGGTGGGGRGGDGYDNSNSGSAGTVNTGGGGGGRTNQSSPTAWSGGSGIVIVRYAK